ncbi:DUF2490 domain-containing protein [Sphingomonas sp. ASY06-1R]|uniref:DUF2490 domain-containing protein n=1 Tax=Sphingomonas sp. ASY06-1R TaxID=3445771 RepID=UPI003FA317D2
MQVWPTVTLTASAKRWDFRGDAILGLTDDASRAGQLLLRAILSYRVTEKLSVGGGYTYFTVNDGLGSRFNEHRLVEEISYRSSRSPERTTFTLRTRLEQRFPEKGDRTALRLRQFSRIDLPIARDGLKAIAWNEMFYAFNKTNWSGRSGFSSMFNFAGVGVPLTPRLHAELGQLNQTGFRPGRNNVRHIVQATLLVAL